MQSKQDKAIAIAVAGHNLKDKTNPQMSNKWNKLTDYQRKILLRQSNVSERFAMMSYGNMGFDKVTKLKVMKQSVLNDRKIADLKNEVKGLREERRDIMQNHMKTKLGRLDDINHKIPFIVTHVENLGGHFTNEALLR